MVWTWRSGKPRFRSSSGGGERAARMNTVKEDFSVTMLRCPRARLVPLLFVGMTAAGLTLGRAAEPTASAGKAMPPRPLMRLPDWIESIGGRDRQPVRSPAAPAAPSATVLTGGWTELADEAAAKADREQAQATAAPAGPAKPPLGPESSVLAAESTPAASAADAVVADREPAPVREAVAESATSPDPSPSPKASVEAAANAAPAAAPRPVAPSAVRPAAVAASTAPEPHSQADAPTLAVDPASFRGALPGKTTRAEIEASWGPGEEFVRDDDVKGLSWAVEPFERVEATIEDDVVSSIRIKLAEPVALKQLAAQMEIGDLRTVSILDDSGVSIGEVFPERGIVISVQPGTQTALAVLLEPLDPEPFVLRAEGEIDQASANAVADLQYAIEIDPHHVRAHRLLLALLAEQGRWQQALAVAEALEKLDAEDVWTQFKHADVCLALGQTDEARARIERIQKLDSAPPLVAAQAARTLGRIETAAESPDYQRSVVHFEEAIRKATPLAKQPSKAVQKAAREVLLDAHLGTALAIARGTWQQKGRVIPKWIGRSEAIVQESGAEGADRARMELTLCRGALAVAASSSEGVDSLPWVKRLLEAREKLDAHVEDANRRREADWEVGLCLSDAIAAAMNRGDASDMLENATLTAAYLERGAERRQLTDAERRTMGDLMFRIGILHSLQNGAHATAVTWFDKVVPLWENNAGFTREGDVGRLGESFVSMAISYWQVDRRDDAMKLSRTGVDLMVEAVDRQQLEERSLAVAYGNLSTMYAEQGNDEKSRTYAEMASRAETADTRLR